MSLALEKRVSSSGKGKRKPSEDSHGLRIPEPIRGRVASAARVVVMQRMNLVEPQQPPEVCKLWVDRPAEICFQTVVKRLLDVARESGSGEYSRQFTIQTAIVIRCRINHWGH